MAKETKTNEVVEVVNEVKEVTLPAVQNDPVNVVELPPTNGGHSVGKNILIGVGIAGGAALAGFGLGTLIKKGVSVYKEKKKERAQKRGNDLPHPQYEYEKNENNHAKDKDGETEAKVKNRPMGFHPYK